MLVSIKAHNRSPGPHRWPRATPYGAPTPQPGRARDPLLPILTPCLPPAGRNPTSFTTASRRTWLGPAPATCSAKTTLACSKSSNSTPIMWPRGSIATQPTPKTHYPPCAARAATPPGATSTTPTSCRCPTSGNTRGYAAWDLAFHCLPLAAVGTEFAKSQLHLLSQNGYLHPNGQVPAHEWKFEDVNSPVHA